jgi:hypothetical protein
MRPGHRSVSISVSAPSEKADMKRSSGTLHLPHIRRCDPIPDEAAMLRRRDHDAPTLVLAAYAVVAVAIAVTYSRLPASRFYNVSGAGLTLGLSRMLVFLGYSTSLAAVAVLAFAADRLLSSCGPRSRRVVLALTCVAFLSCATIVWPGVVNQANLDAKLANIPAAIGVTITAALVIAARRAVHSTHGRGRDPTGTRRGTRTRAAIAVVGTVIAAPYVFADLGIYVGDIPLLHSVFMSRQLRPEPGHPLLVAVHLGHHEGMDGLLLIFTALLLAPIVVTLSRRLLRIIVGFYLCLLLVYGSWVLAGDDWHEQIVKRGWTTYKLPDVLQPTISTQWAVLLLIAIALYAAGFARTTLATRPD